MCDTLPANQRDRVGDAARRGTAAHALLERCLREKKNPEKFRGWWIVLHGKREDPTFFKPSADLPPTDEPRYEVDFAMIEGTSLAVDYVKDRVKELGVTLKQVQLETRTNPLPERLDATGTADVTIDAFPKLLEVVDYKNGFMVVDHVNNEQLLDYLLGKALEKKFAHAEYCVTVVQPNALHDDGKVRTFYTTKDDLLTFQQRLRDGIALCEQAEQELTLVAAKDDDSRTLFKDWAEMRLVSGDHCTFCEAQAVCPARKKFFADEAQIDFANEPMPIIFPEREEEVARIMRWVPQMKTLINAVETYAERALQAGLDVPGFKLVEQRTKRELIALPQKTLLKSLLKGKFIRKITDVFHPAELMSGPQIEKIVPREKRKEFKERFLTRPEGKAVIAPEDDPRDAVNPRPSGEDFPDDLGDE